MTPEIRHLGLKLPEALDNCLRLQSLIQGRGKSDLVRDIIQQYAEDNNWSEVEMLERFARYLYNQWDLRFRDKMTIEEYVHKRDMNVPEPLLLVIISKCNEIVNQENQSTTK